MLDGRCIPGDRLPDEEHRGSQTLVRNLRNDRIVLGAQAMGEAQRPVALALLARVRQRGAFGASLWNLQPDAPVPGEADRAGG